ncbi:MAG: FAD:protein FMN transferase [Dehalococcoidia bacterium]|nr:FAD:protein FMN transferase [Dehalococcoidia bacterium]
MQFDEQFRAMDTDVDVALQTWAPAFDATLSVRLLFERQEAAFSRFRPESLLSALNRGETVTDAGFVQACRMAIQAFEMTGGLFNPMVLPALREAGYDRTFAEVRGGSPRRQDVPDPRSCLDFGESGVRLRSGALDLGGIVKGWTVDLAVELLADRFDGVLVNAGGDLRCSGGEEPGAPGWTVEIEGPDGTLAWEGTWMGALATSTVAKRRWVAAAQGEAHHLIDPRTGLPAESGYAQVSTRGALTWRAEVWAKAVLIGGPELATLAAGQGHGVLAIAPDGHIEAWNWER